jgi:hypothetical protein
MVISVDETSLSVECSRCDRIKAGQGRTWNVLNNLTQITGVA